MCVCAREQMGWEERLMAPCLFRGSLGEGRGKLEGGRVVWNNAIS